MIGYIDSVIYERFGMRAVTGMVLRNYERQAG